MELNESNEVISSLRLENDVVHNNVVAMKKIIQ